MDQKLFFLINHEWTSPRLDLLMAALSSLDLWMPLFAVLGVAVAFWGGFRGRALLLTLALTLLLSDGVISGTLKKVVNRPRPWQAAVVRQVDLARVQPRFLALGRPLRVKDSAPVPLPVEGRSFPSSHVMNTMAAGVVLAAFLGRRAWPFFLVAAAVGFSRIYTGSHWPSDVLISMPMGLAVGWLGLRAAEGAWSWAGPRWVRSVWERNPRVTG
jgi:undecaprenyl-diphosphatase